MENEPRARLLTVLSGPAESEVRAQVSKADLGSCKDRRVFITRAVVGL